MAGAIKIGHTDVFDEPADAVVLPCATDGTLKDFARRTREDWELPGPPNDLTLGQLKLICLEHARAHCQYLIYAVARDETGSSSATLYRIGSALGELTRSDDIKTIAAPLLGTGAGMVPLIPAIQAVVDGFRSTADAVGILSLCAPRKKTFKTAMDWYSGWRVAVRQAPRVFISYNQKTQSDWASLLYEFLVGNGVNAVVDRWRLKLTMHLGQWMSEEITEAEKVIVISDEEYARKADAHEGGVGEETEIIEEELRSKGSWSKYIIVAREQNLKTCLPRYLQGRLVLCCASVGATPATLQEILRALYDEGPPPPSSGSRPIYVPA